jgi:hypothetical protein
MAITSDQEQRTEAPWTDFEVRFFVGADRMLGDLTAITAGQNYDPDASTTLSADVNFDDDSIPVVSTTGFGAGFIVIHPEDAGEHYEIIAYGSKTSTTFDDLQRFETDGAKAVHASGATVSEWMEVTSYLHNSVSLDLTQDDEIADWTASISGHSYLSTIFQPDRAFLCLWRFRPASGVLATWTDWWVGFIGFLQDISVDGDWQQANPWTARVVSLGYYVAKTDVKSGVTYGVEDLAEGKTVEVSSFLEDVYQEANTGEFVGTPSLDGDRIVDADLATLWMSDGEPSPTLETTQASAGVVNEVFARPYTWMPDDLQWIELHFKSTQNMAPAGWGGYYLAADCTTWKWVWDPAGRTPANNYLDLPRTPSPEIGDDYICILTANKPTFMAYFPQCQCDVFDWRPLMVGDFEIDTTGDFLALRFWGVTHTDIVWFDNGRSGWALHDFCGGGSHFYSAGGTLYSGWTGAMITLPPVGHSFRRTPTGNKNIPGTVGVFKQDEDHPTPGDYITGEPEWAIVDLGTLGISLSAALAQYHTTKAELTGHLGITDGPGYVGIDSEIIKYETVDRLNNELLTLTRGQYSTSDVLHPSGSTVYQYEDGANTDRYQVQSFQWRRRPVYIGSVLDVPRHFDVYATTYDAGYPTPDESAWGNGLGSGGWEDYWKRIAVARYYSQTQWKITIVDPLRVKKVMLAVRYMRAAGRVKVNELSVFAPTGYILTAGTEDGEWTGGMSSAIISDLLQTWLSLSASNITITAEGRQISSLDVTRDRIATAIRDICRSVGTMVFFRLDNTVDIDWHAMMPFGAWPAVEIYWDRDNARSIRFGRQTRTNVAQVVVKLVNQETEESYEVTYPSIPFPIGDIVEIDDGLLIDSEDDASFIAQLLFNIESLTDTVDIVPVGIAEWALPGQRHVVTYDVDGDDTFLSGHNVVATGVRHTINLGNEFGEGKSWATEISARRVEYA